MQEHDICIMYVHIKCVNITIEKKCSINVQQCTLYNGTAMLLLNQIIHISQSVLTSVVSSHTSFIACSVYHAYQ